MVNPFEQTPAEKEEYVLDMLQRGYGWNQITKECHVSPNTISSIKKKYYGSTEDEASKSASQISKDTQALKLFKEGWKPLDIAIELDLEPDSVFQIQKEFYQLIGLDDFNQAYHQINGNLEPFLQLINSMKIFGMNVGQILDAVKCGNALPYLQNLHTKVSNEIHVLSSYRNKLHSELNLIVDQIEDCKYSLEYYANESEQKKNQCALLDYQIKDLQNFIQEFDNQQGYQRIKKESAEQTISIIKNNRQLIAITVSSALEALRRYPHSQQLFYDLSARWSDSNSLQQTRVHSHATQILQLSKQVQIEIVEKIAKNTIFFYREKERSKMRPLK